LLIPSFLSFKIDGTKVPGSTWPDLRVSNQNLRNSNLGPEFPRTERGVLLEKVIEMRSFLETEAVRDLGHIPVGVLQKDLGFLHNALGNELGGGLLRPVPPDNQAYFVIGPTIVRHYPVFRRHAVQLVGPENIEMPYLLLNRPRDQHGSILVELFDCRGLCHAVKLRKSILHKRLIGITPQPLFPRLGG
jgi:hypothetical protein